MPHNPMTLQFLVTRATKNTIRFDQVVRDGGPTEIGALYVQKWAMPLGVIALRVTLDFEIDTPLQGVSHEPKV